MDPVDFSGLEVGVIGGLGRMGRWISRQWEQAGCRVRVADLKGRPPDAEFVRACRVLTLAVPVTAVEEVMAQAGPHTRVDGLVLDIASLKQGPLESMLAHARGAVAGTHPLCGPSAASLKGQTVFVCPGRGAEWLERLSRFLEQAGARVVEMDPPRHDRLMARVQTLRHLFLHCLGGALASLEFQPGTDLENSGPWFQGLMEMLGAQARQPSELYADLALNNPEGAKVSAALLQCVQETADALAQGDRRRLIAMMDGVRDFAGGLPASA
jgi:prephenate dehydrogenase